MPALPADRVFGRTTVLGGEQRGKYPHGNSLLVAGTEESLLVDPSLSLVSRSDGLPRVDRILHSHCHEDHIAASHLFLKVPWFFHELDLFGIHSLDGLMALYGYAAAYPGIDVELRESVVRDFHFMPRPDAVPFRDGQVFDLGGGVRVRVIHAPGHTRGHSFFHVEPDDVLYLGDVELSSFGPYYGDAWSDLESFERTLEMARGLTARWYATFHHVGVVEGREAFLARLDRFEAVIADRERRLLEFLHEPRTLDEITTHRFVFRPQDPMPHLDAIERRSMSQHLERCLRSGLVREVEAGRYLAC